LAPVLNLPKPDALLQSSILASDSALEIVIRPMRRAVSVRDYDECDRRSQAFSSQFHLFLLILLCWTEFWLIENMLFEITRN